MAADSAIISNCPNSAQLPRHLFLDRKQRRVLERKQACKLRSDARARIQVLHLQIAMLRIAVPTVPAVSSRLIVFVLFSFFLFIFQVFSSRCTDALAVSQPPAISMGPGRLFNGRRPGFPLTLPSGSVSRYRAASCCSLSSASFDRKWNHLQYHRLTENGFESFRPLACSGPM